MNVVKVCNPRHANFHVRTSARSGYWLVRGTTSYMTTAYKALKTKTRPDMEIRMSRVTNLHYMHIRERISMVALALTPLG